MSLYVGPGGAERLGDVLREQFGEPWTGFRAAVAYAKMSGVDHVYERLRAFADRGDSEVTMTVGIDQHGTSYEALAALLDALEGGGHRLYVRHNPRSHAGVPSPTFHPKVWLFHGEDRAKALLGSGNLTQGGLYTNHEVGTVRSLDVSSPDDAAELGQIVGYLDRCCDDSRGDVVRLTQETLDELAEANLVLSESELRRVARTSARARVAASGRNPSGTVGSATLFPGEDVPPPPEVGDRPERRRPPGGGGAAPGAAPGARKRITRAAPASPIPIHSSFFIHLSKANKTELYLAKAPMRDDPAFFGLPFTGRTHGDPPQPQADPWPMVDATVYAPDGSVKAHELRPMKFWQYMEGENANDDVRIYLGKAMGEEIEDGSVLAIERDPGDEIDFALSAYPPGHPDFDDYDALCTEPLPNSWRRYGWS